MVRSPTPASTAALIAAMLVVGVSFGAAAPLVSSILEERGFSEYFTGAVSAVLSVALAFGSPFAGRLVERRGPAPVLAWGLVGQAAGFAGLGLALATEERLLLAVRFGLGLAATATFVAAEVALLRASPPGAQGRVMAAYGTALGLGFAGGIFLSAAAYRWLGLGSFGLVAALALGVFPLAVRGARGSVAGEASTKAAPAPAGPLPWRGLLLALSGAVVFGAVDTGMSGAYPVEGQRIGLDAAACLHVVGLLFTGTVVAQPVAGWLADRVGPRRVLVLLAFVGLLASVAAGLVSASAVPDVRLVAAAFFAIGVAAGGAYPASLKLLADRTPDALLPRANARFAAAYGYASLLAPILAAGGIDLAERAGRLGWAVPSLALATFALVPPLAALDRLVRGGTSLDDAAQHRRRCL